MNKNNIQIYYKHLLLLYLVSLILLTDWCELSVGALTSQLLMYIIWFINVMLKFIFFKQPIGVSSDSKWSRVTDRWSFAISAFSIRRSTRASKRSSNSANPDTAPKWRTIFYTGATLLKEPPGWLRSLKLIWILVVKL